MKIAIDIDSTLHHYWDILSGISARRFGIDLPYEEQLTWGVTRLRPEQLALCVEESHSHEQMLANTPYPGAVETVQRWHRRGHSVHITAHRDFDRRGTLTRWLQRIELPFDGLHCSEDRVGLCIQLGIDVLIDDGPLNLAGAIERGIAAATIVHPWNRDLCEEEDVFYARDWPELERLLEPLLGLDECARMESLAGGG